MKKIKEHEKEEKLLKQKEEELQAREEALEGKHRLRKFENKYKLNAECKTQIKVYINF
jgi:hypothetical protein